jgi:hypothetical protein
MKCYCMSEFRFSLRQLDIPVFLVVFLVLFTQVMELKLRGLSRKRAIPTEQPPLVGEVSANFC